MKIKNVVCNLYDAHDYRYVNLDAPKTCPHCLTGFSGIVLTAAQLSSDSNIVGAVHFCPACSELFYATYVYDNSFNPEECDQNLYKLNKVYPAQKFKRKEFSKRIQSISPQFQELYNQAAQAESLGLFDICGMGYRKAMEFLVKDYTILKNPEKQEQIVKSNLSSCIETYICNVNIKQLSLRAAWLGNDHTHYKAKHTDKDLNDLKQLIDLTIAWFEVELQTQEAIHAILPKK